MLYEATLRKYLTTFDGKKKDFTPEVEHLFDSLYHEKFVLIFSDGKKATRENVKEMHAGYLAKGAKLTLLHFRKIGFECVDVEFHIKCEDEDKPIRLVFSIEDNKLAMSQVVNDSLLSIMKARCASNFRLFTVLGKYQTNM